MTDEYENDEEIILSELPDNELIEQMHDDIYDGLADEIAEGTRILLERGWDAPDVLEKALVGGMAAVGVDFRPAAPSLLAKSWSAPSRAISTILAKTWSA